METEQLGKFPQIQTINTTIYGFKFYKKNLNCPAFSEAIL